LSNNLRELRIHVSQTKPGSQGARDFINRNTPNFVRQTPNLPILIREAAFVEARAFGRYDFGVERKVALEGLSEAEVESKLKELAESRPSASQH
ncbi:NADH:ubiquinone oxidoreductase 11 kDa subunit, partial [Chytridium lagenaria]